MWFAAAFSGQDTAGSFTLVRDGATVQPVDAAWTVSGACVELALGAELQPGAVYTLTHATAGSTTVAWKPVGPAPGAIPRLLDVDVETDVEAEVLGLDLDWVAPALTADHDIPTARGVAVLKHDLAVLWLTSRGELVHRPRAGVGAASRVNRSGSPGAVSELQAATRAAFLSDDRVAQVRAAMVQDGSRFVLRCTDLSIRALPGESFGFAVRL